MKKLWLYFGMLVAVILSGCGAPVGEGILDSDWCYMFDFTQNQQGFTIATGTMLPQGMASDITGLLQTSYGYNRDVYPSIVQVRVFRPPGVADEILTTAAGTVFGVSAYFTAPMAAELDSAELTFRPEGGGVEIIGDRNAINITIDATQPIGIESIFIGGQGASPFPYNLCGPDTPTPPVDINGTGTAIASTPSPSPTVTATGTPPTATDAPDSWVCVYDFTIDDHGWSSVGTSFPGTTRDGSGWHSEYQDGGYRGASLHWVGAGPTYEINTIIIDLNLEQGIIDPGAEGTQNTVFVTGVGALWAESFVDPVDEPLVLTGDFEFGTLDLRFYAGLHSTEPGGAVDIFSVTFVGTGTQPPDAMCDDATPTPTTTPSTPTPGPTNTQEPLWSACIDFTASRYTFTAVGADYEEDRGFIQEDPDEWSVGRSGLDPTAKKKVKIVFGAGQTFSGQIRFTDNGSNSTSWLTVAGNEIFLDYSVSAWLPTSTFWIEFDGGFEELILERVCWLDPNPSTGTPIPGTGTAVGTRTPLPTTTARPLPSRTPIGIPLPPVIIITATGGVPITTTPIYGGTGVYSATGTTSPLITGTPGAEGTPAGDGTGYGSGGGGFGDIGDMVGFAWNIGWGLFGALIAYLGQATNIVTGLLSAFANATPQPIPGLPMCITNPMAHDLCAIWYIIDNTIFAPGTPGQYIIPLLQIIFNVVIAIIFVRMVMRIIWRGESVTHVE